MSDTVFEISVFIWGSAFGAAVTFIAGALAFDRFSQLIHQRKPDSIIEIYTDDTEKAFQSVHLPTSSSHSSSEDEDDDDDDEGCPVGRTAKHQEETSSPADQETPEPEPGKHAPTCENGCFHVHKTFPPK